jgi:hypothetical protein
MSKLQQLETYQLRLKQDMTFFSLVNGRPQTSNTSDRVAPTICKAAAAIVRDADGTGTAPDTVTRVHKTLHQRHRLRTQPTSIRNAVIAAASAIVRTASSSARAFVEATGVHKTIHWAFNSRANERVSDGDEKENRRHEGGWHAKTSHDCFVF